HRSLHFASVIRRLSPSRLFPYTTLFRSGPLADVASLVGERVAVHFVPIEHRVEGGKGTLRVGEIVEAEMAPYTDANGRPTTIHDTVFSTIPGSPAYLAKASHHRVHIPEYGMLW